MDWDQKSLVTWIADDTVVPPAGEFEQHSSAVQWDHAIEALDASIGASRSRGS